MKAVQLRRAAREQAVVRRLMCPNCGSPDATVDGLIGELPRYVCECGYEAPALAQFVAEVTHA